MNAEGEVRFWARSLRNPLAWALAALSALWFLLFSQSSSLMQAMAPSAGGTFAKALCLGLAACGAMGVLLCVKDSYREKSLKAASPRFFAFLAGFGGLCTAIGFLAGFWSPPGAMPLIGGAFAGFGFGCVALAAFDCLGRRSVRELAALMAVALAGFAVLHGLGAMLSGASAVAFGAALLAFAVAALLGSRAGVDGLPAPGAPERSESAGPTVPQRLSSFARCSWSLFAVVLISMFMLGFNWDPVRLSLFPVRPLLLACEESAGALAAAIVLGFLRRAPSNADALARLQWGIVPVVVATFVIVPYFPLESTGAVFYEMVGFVRSASIFIFAAGLMAVLTAAARTADASLPFACALALMLSGLCLCAGFGMARAFGAAANAVVVLMFVAYLVAVVIIRSVAHGDEQKVRALEREVFDAYLSQRCAVIAERYELSPRESEMLAWLSRGHGYVYIAQLAFVSEGTVRTHAKNIFRKCGVSSREELIDLVDERPLP